jgi:tetratricopeptide (TPR) repeat protein
LIVMMNRHVARLALVSVTALLALTACDMVRVYQSQIDKATRDLAAATTDSARAAAYADRGRGYSNKARLAFVRHQIGQAEYVRLFDLAMKDHDQAVALDSGNAEPYFARGLSHYDRAAWADQPVPEHATWFEAARADFSAAVAKNPRHNLAYDYLGLVDEQAGRFDEAIADYTHEMELDPKMGKARLADLYCNRGQIYLRDKNYDLATLDLEKAVSMGIRSDGCSCEPYNSLAYIYIDAQPQPGKGWDLVRRAAKSGHFIAPEYLVRLETSTGKSAH